MKWETNGIEVMRTLEVQLEFRMGCNNCSQQATLALLVFEIGNHLVPVWYH